jgi:nucleotide-binding universal stress UspA family protein
MRVTVVLYHPEGSMTATWKPQWIKPATILFAATVPVNEKAFRFAIAEAAEHKACLILFNAYDTFMTSTAQASGIVYYDFDGARIEAKRSLEPLAERARAAGVQCRLEVKAGLAAQEILAFAREFAVDRIVMGTRSPGSFGKLFVGSVAEEVLRKSPVPVCVVGPNAVDGAYRHYAVRRILCGVSHLTGFSPATTFAAELAAEYGAHLTLLHVDESGQRHGPLSADTVIKLEHAMLAMMPHNLVNARVDAIVSSGEPAIEILCRGRAPLADLIVLSAHEASTVETVARSGVVYKVIAGAECPVLTLSPALLAAAGVLHQHELEENYFAGVF